MERSERRDIHILAESLAGLSLIGRILKVAEGASQLVEVSAAWAQCRSEDTFTETNGPVTSSSAPFVVTLSWDQAVDIDLHTIAPDGSHSYFQNMTIQDGFLDQDNVKGYGPEHFTATQPTAGIYQVLVNYYGNGSIPSNARIRIDTADGRHFDRGPYTLTVPDKNSDYPVTSNTGSWWRVCDVVVGNDGGVSVMDPDPTVPVALIRSHNTIRAKKSYER